MARTVGTYRKFLYRAVVANHFHVTEGDHENGHKSAIIRIFEKKGDGCVVEYGNLTASKSRMTLEGNDGI